MKQRLPKGTTAIYNSFEEVAQAWHCREHNKQTKDEVKLAEQRERFSGKCKVCGQPLVYMGGNIMVCSNQNCLGFKNEKINEDGTVEVRYYPVYRLLDDKGAEIANAIFA